MWISSRCYLTMASESHPTPSTETSSLLSDLHQTPIRTNRPKSSRDRIEIITTLWTDLRPSRREYRLHSRVLRNSIIFQCGDSAALVRSSEGDVYYRIDSICEGDDGQQVFGSRERPWKKMLWWLEYGVGHSRSKVD